MFLWLIDWRVLQGRGRGSMRGGRGGNLITEQLHQQPGIPSLQQQPQQQQQQQPQQQLFSNRLQHKGPQVVPTMGNSTLMTQQPIQQQQQQTNAAGTPNLMQKLNEITAPGGDILSKGKELIFMKFGLGGK